jgi:hypothetical protein
MERRDGAFSCVSHKLSSPESYRDERREGRGREEKKNVLATALFSPLFPHIHTERYSGERERERHMRISFISDNRRTT